MILQRIVLVVVLLCLPSSSFGQVQEQRRAYGVIVGAQRQQWKEEEELRRSKMVGVVEVPKVLRHRNYCLDIRVISDGTVGYLEGWQYRVLQVIDEKNMLVWTGVEEIPPLWVEGHPTRGLVDDDLIRLVGPVEILGTKRYDTLDGSRTVRIVRFLSEERIKELEKSSRKRGRSRR